MGKLKHNLWNVLWGLGCLLIAAQVSAEQKVQLGNWDIHYMVLPSTFISPHIAKQYDLQRSRYQALITVAVLDKQSQQNQNVALRGTAINELGQPHKLNFAKVQEQHGIYYLAQLSLDEDGKPWHFDITIQSGNQQQTLSFDQILYIE